MTDLIEIRQKLYEILTADVEDRTPDIKASQNMGVNLSHAMKKEGVTIVQMQNVVSKQVIKHVTEALKLLDAMDLENRLAEVQDAQIVEPEPEQIEDTRPTMQDFFEAAIARGLSLSDLCKRVGGMYLLAMLEKYPNEETARRRLRIQSKRFEEIKQEAEEDK